MKITFSKIAVAFAFTILTGTWLAFTLPTQARPLLTEVGGTIAVNTTWTTANSPYIVTDSIFVADGVVLTVEPGVVVKFGAGHQLSLGISSQLLAVGSAQQPIIFTSARDDTQSGDTNGDGQATLPAAGDWVYLWGRGTNSTLHLEHTLVRYNSIGVYANANLTLLDSTVEDSNTNNVYASPHANTTPTFLVERNTLRKSGFYGLELRGQPGTLTVRNNNFERSQGGAFIYDITTAQIEDNTFTFANLDGTGLYLEGVGSGVNIVNNTISHTGNPSSRPGIEVKNSAPQLTNNQVHGFEMAVLINDGYPQQVPTYTGNDFSANRLLGIAISGQVQAGSWSKISGYPHFIHGSVIIANGATFSFNPGDVVKLNRGALLQLGTGATLRALGTAANPVVFTSIKDDEYDGDSNGDGQATVPEPGDWSYIWSNGQASTIQFQHTLVRYGGNGAIYANSNLTFQDSIVERSSGTGINVSPYADTTPIVKIVRTALRKNLYAGIEVQEQPGELQISNNLLIENYLGIRLFNVTSAQLVSNTLTFVNNYPVGIYAEAVGAGVTVEDNTLSYSGSSSTNVGIEIKNSTLVLTNNRVHGFAKAVEISGGYPQKVPTYTNNDFSGNQLDGIAVSGEINTGTWSSIAGYPHFLSDSASVANGATLTILPGTVLKLSAAHLSLGTGAKLIAVGTLEQPIIFTSIKDDEYEGDSNNDGQATLPGRGDWNTIFGAGVASVIQLQHTLIRYGSYPIQANGSLILQDSTVEQSNSIAIYISPNADTAPTVTIERSLLRDNYTSLQIVKLPGSFNFTGNALINNQIAINSDSVSGAVNAPGNWWGKATGPALDDPKNKVSANVNFANWLTTEPAFVPIERPKQDPNKPAASPDSYEANDSCGQAGAIANDGVFQEHTFHAQGDTDWVQFSAAAATTYRIEVQPVGNSLADVNLEIYTQCNAALADSWQATFTPGVRLDFAAPQAGTVYLKLNNYDANVYGLDLGYRIAVRPLQSTTQKKGAVIIMAGRLKGADRLQANIHHITDNVYTLFKASGYSDDNINYLATDPTLAGRDSDATLATLQAAITTWAVSKVSVEQPLTLYLMDHGGIDTFYVDGVNGQTLAPALLNEWLTQLEAAVPGVKLTVVIEACYSGSFIEGAQRISKAGRLIITSTNAQNVAYASSKGAQFSDRFLTSLREGYGFSNSFWDAQYSVRRLNALQEPWIDANGNGVPNETADGADANTHSADNQQQPADLWAPFIATAQGPTAIVDNKGLLRAEVRDNKGVKRVWAAIYSPGYNPPTNVEELVAEDVPTIDLTALGNHQFSAEYDQFNADGLYRIALYAEDNDGLKAKFTLLEVRKGVTTDGQLFLPLVSRSDEQAMQ